MNGNWLRATSRIDYISIKKTSSNSAKKCEQLNDSFAEFGLEMAQLF